MGSIVSSGTSAQEDEIYSAGGSGGSIQIYYTVLKGLGTISAVGGNSNNLGGEGGGGRIKMFF